MLVPSQRLRRIARLAIAPMKGFFSLKTDTTRPRFDPDRTSVWAHLKEVAWQDAILFFEPFTRAMKEFRDERAKPY
jgi:hypothetical protein